MDPHQNYSYSSKLAFSLVELSIVLVILGLLVGSVLAGQALIKAAELRKQIKLPEQLETATRAFQDKYLSMPGDISNATSFFASSGMTIVNGNANGTVDASNLGGQNYYIATYSNEMAQYYVQLVAAGLFTGIQPTGTSFVGGGDFPLNPASTMPQTTGMALLYVNSAYLNGFSTPEPSGHYLLLNTYATGITINTTQLKTNGSVNFLSDTLLQIDTKIDDGKPATGRLIAISSVAAVDGRRNYAGAWGYNGYCANGTDYINMGSTSYTYAYGAFDPGNCYPFYRLF